MISINKTTKIAFLYLLTKKVINKLIITSIRTTTALFLKINKAHKQLFMGFV